MQKKKIIQQDLFERMNYLYQAAHVVLSSNPRNSKFANFYTHILRNIAKRAVLKLDTSIKRTLCRKCNALLMPGLTSTFRIRKRSAMFLTITCLQCKTSKRFPCRSGYLLWSERKEALIDDDEEIKQPQQQKEEIKQPQQKSNLNIISEGKVCPVESFKPL